MAEKLSTLMDNASRALDTLVAPLADLLTGASVAPESGFSGSTTETVQAWRGKLARILNLNIAPPPDGARRRMKDDDSRAAFATWSADVRDDGIWHISMHPDAILAAAAGSGTDVDRLTAGLLLEVATCLAPPVAVARKNGTIGRNRFHADWTRLAKNLGLTRKNGALVLDDSKVKHLRKAVTSACNVAAPSIGARDTQTRLRFAIVPIALAGDGSIVGPLMKNAEKDEPLRLSIGEAMADRLFAAGEQRFIFTLQLGNPEERDEKGQMVWYEYDKESLARLQAALQPAQAPKDAPEPVTT